jgi:hypothetical protein
MPDFGRVWADMRVLLVANRWAVLPVVAAFLFLPQLLLARMAGSGPAQSDLAALPPGLLIVLLGTGLAGLVGQIFVTHLVLRAGEGETVGALLGRSAALLPQALALGLVQAMALMPAVLLLRAGTPVGAILGLAALGGGLYLVSRILLLVPLLVAERLSIADCVKRSWAMTQARGLRVLGLVVVLLFGLLMMLVVFAGLGSALAAMATLVAGAPDTGWGLGRWLAELVTAGASAAASLALTLFIAMLYRGLAAEAA